MGYAVDIRTVPARTLAVARFHVRDEELQDMGIRMGTAFGRVMAALGAAHAVPVGPPVARYERAGDGFDVAAGFPTTAPVAVAPDGDGITTVELPAGEVAHTTHIGPYTELHTAYDALRAGAESQGRHLDDGAAMWEEYLTGPETPPAENRTEIYWPVAA